ncbi:MAG: OmpA family protein [Paracoccaceae bacterium]
MKGAAAFALAPTLAIAQPTGLALPEGAVETGRQVESFDRLTVPVGPVGRGSAAPVGRDPVGSVDRDAIDPEDRDPASRGAGGLRPVEGRVSLVAWRLDGDERTPLALVTALAERLETVGWERRFDCVDRGCGGVEVRFALTFLPAPAMRLDTADMALATLYREGEGWLSLTASRALGTLYVQSASVAPSGVTTSGVAPEADTAVEPGAAEAAETLTLAPDAAALGQRLAEDGHVALAGLVFESGTSTLAPAAERAIAALVALFEADPALSARVVGHSDDTGDLAANRALSLERAERVVAALVARGVAAERLEAHGVGPLAPVASNATAAGRALNRRVELVPR